MPSLIQSCCSCAILLAVFATSASAQIPAHSARMELVNGKPYVMVMVNGQGPFRFVVDTGTGGQALVTSALADKLQLPVVGHARLIDPSGQGEQRAQIVLLQSLSVAGVEFIGVKAIQHSLAAEDDTCQGLLGFTLFRDYLLKLDYPNRQITLASGSLTPDGERLVMPFRMPDGIPIASLRIGNVRVDAQIDSGGAGLSLPEPLVPHLKFAADPVPFGKGESLSTRFQVKVAKLGGDVRLGRYTFQHPYVEINPAFPLANFGGFALQNFAVTFDQKSLLMRLEARHKVFHLDTLPTTTRLRNAPSAKSEPGLVPVG
ncbi:MAG: retropepsin-like aspartic protease [Terracidiphilus sp.]